ncbi:putative pheromone receptor [Guyanagaster necrorhizus]|uniref:Pheromone receptor n=1 Tax=Guyanagaster necrorhizus TaxID=856835 RepID=A0A9P7VKJ5_9AGAR|nr:putative pheromone receptor [Guyanagaster necrorhizus MCA 3950]KAG7442050.1 putative pheromone receptor [Guyanagaster necrorhizus MCA 3950]
MASPNYVFSIFAFLGFIISMIPFYWHMEAWNIGTCSYMLWVGFGCFMYFINSIVWNGNAINWAPVWCDISSRYIIALTVAIPICSLCINRRLYYIATSDAVMYSRKEKRRAIIIDLAMCIGVPVLEMIIAYIPQGNRFNIYGDIGCMPAIYQTWVAVVLYLLPPILIGCVSAVYCILTIIAFNRRRLQFKEVLSAHSNLSSSRYYRLMFMASVDLMLTVPLATYILVMNTHDLQPWISWENVHFDFSRVDQIPAILWRSVSAGTLLELQRWLVVMGAFVFFLLFGFADEAKKHYRAAYSSVLKRVSSSSLGSTNLGSKWTSSGNGSLPVFIEKKVVKKHDSSESFTDMSLSHSNDSKEKSFSGDMSFGAYSFADVGGALSSTPPKDPFAPKSIVTSSSSSVISDSSSSTPPKYTSQEDLTIEISSVRHLSIIEPAVPPRTLDLSNIPRHLVDLPKPVGANTPDVV